MRVEQWIVCCVDSGWEEETLRHFVVECRELQEIRRRYGVGIYLTEALEPLWNFSSRNRVTPVSIQDGV